jgi:hypothetical protein
MVTARTKRTTRTAGRRPNASNSSVGPLSSIRIPSSPEVGRHHESEHRADDRDSGDEQDEQ